MFEALFILTTIDAGTRVGRFVMQELLGKVYKPFSNEKWLIGTIFSSALIVFVWGYFIYTGSISTIWPVFGITNILLATIALALSTSYIISIGKKNYAFITMIPMCFIFTVSFIAGIMHITGKTIPMIQKSVNITPAIVSLSFLVIIFICVFIVLYNSGKRWIKDYGFGE